MTLEIAATMAILLVAIVLFVTEILRVDLIALLVLAALALTGLVSPEQALSGFSNPAVITVWAVFILSGGLSRTGVANVLGRNVMRLSGQGEVRLLVVIMVTAAVLSAFMNNIGVAALLLPVVIGISQKTRIPASKLLLPLAYGSLLGGLMTLIGTPPNILASNALREYGLEPFGFFSFAPVGVVIMIAGVAFMAVIGRRLLPERHPVQSLAGQNGGRMEPEDFFALDERLALVEIPPGTPFAGKTIAESRLGRALGITILGIERNGRKQIDIAPQTVLQDKDRLLVLGNLERLEELSQRPYLVLEPKSAVTKGLYSPEDGLAELIVDEDSTFAGGTIARLNLRQTLGLNLLAIRRGALSFFSDLQDIPLQSGDRLLVHGANGDLEETHPTFNKGKTLSIGQAGAQLAEPYGLAERLLIVRIPHDSPLSGRPLSDSDLADTYGITVLSIKRGDAPIFLPEASTILQAGDLLWVEGDPADLVLMRSLQNLRVTRDFDHQRVELESPGMALVEAVLSPYTTLVNKTLREIHFREKYGLSVLAIWRNGRSYRTNQGEMALQFGDSFLLFGPREKINMLAREPDFLVLTGEVQEAPRAKLAPVATLIMLAVVISALLGWLPIAIAAVAGAAIMVLTGCLSMEEAYRSIDWRAVFLIACMLPLGIAMEQSGAAQLLANGMVSLVGDMGSLALMTGLFLLTSLASQFMPNAVVTVLLAPIAITTGSSLGISPYALMMVVAIAASASFMSPVGHPANVLVMGPGGYRFSDYVKVGLPLTLVVLIITLLVLPIFWPLSG